MTNIKNAPKARESDSDLIRMYYEHQYDRIERNENHRQTISNYVISLSVLAFTFGFQNGGQFTTINGIGLPLIIIIANVTAIFNIGYTAAFIDIHRNRAHEVLKRHAPELSKIDEVHNFNIGLISRRRWIEKTIHTLLIVLSLMPLVLYLYQIYYNQMPVP